MQKDYLMLAKIYFQQKDDRALNYYPECLKQAYFILMQPNTLAIIHRVWEFRKETSIPLCFTLDAGANVHLLYPKQDIGVIHSFIKEELSGFCQSGQYLLDEVGRGAKKA